MGMYLLEMLFSFYLIEFDFSSEQIKFWFCLWCFIVSKFDKYLSMREID